MIFTSSSKAACDILAESYIKSFYKGAKCNVGIARSGNCIGGGDWTKDRIVKDCVEAFIFNKNLYLEAQKQQDLGNMYWNHFLILKTCRKTFY